MTIEKILEVMREDKAVRRAVVKRSHKFFFHYYFGHYIEYPIAPFHEELFDLSQNDTHSMFVVSAFRNSGKSTLLTLSYVIWSIINGRTKYGLIVSENQQKAQTLLSHIKAELTENELLKRDLGPFQEEKVGWNSVSLTLKNYGAKLTAVSTEQSVRGLRHGSHRPDLIILDDTESQQSVKTQESRDKHFQWLTGDVIPAGHSHTRVIVIGSMLHPDSLIPRLQKGIDEGKIYGIYRMYPIVDEQGNSMWPGKFPDISSIEREKARGIPDREWTIEFLLKPIIDEDQVIKTEHIHYYDRAPEPKDFDYKYAASGVDLAISQSSNADFTAIVSGAVVRNDDGWKLYIYPYPVNEHLGGPDIEDRIVAESLRLGNGTPTNVYIEDVAFQKAMIDFVERRGIPASGVSPGGNDKLARLISISALISLGKIVFPKKGAEKLLNQILYFGTERYDDLSDALIILALSVFKREEYDRITIPSTFGTPAHVPTREEGEKDADEGARLLQEAQRSNDPVKKQQYCTYQNEQRKKYWRNEELLVFNRLMRR